MAFEGEQLQVTELDFQTIKSNLIEYIQNSDTEFSDWNFDGSNLNILMDVLAYNTHYNAMLAHMAVNESFIDSAQLRSSIVSLAKMIGYTPKSYSAPRAVLSAEIGAAENTPSTITLDKGIRFTTTSGIGSFQFVVLDDTIVLTKDSESNSYKTDPDNPIIAYEGILTRKEYAANGADSSQRYPIPENNVDISTLVVKVYKTPSKINAPLTYKKISEAKQNFNISEEINFNGDSPIYFIYENSFGQYEIQFGNGVFGKKLTAGNIIELEYLVTNGSVANGLNSRFILQSQIPDTTNNIISLALAVDPTTGKTIRVSGGGEKESNNQLKINAQNSFVIQNRAVTADDYKNLILANFPITESVSVWGGEDNDPPYYGKAFITIRKKETEVDPSLLLSITDKDDILEFLNKKKILSIQPEIVDPQFINIGLDILFKYDGNLVSNRAELENRIKREFISSYNRDYINSFETIFRHSQFQRLLDNFDPAILNSLVRVFVEQTLTLVMEDVTIDNDFYSQNFYENQTINFGVPLSIDDNRVLIEIRTETATGASTTWNLNSKKVYIADEAHPTDSNLRNLYTYHIELNRSITRLKTIGVINLREGTASIFANTLDSDSDIINIVFVVNPESNDIVGKRNLILQISDKAEASRVFGSPDEIASGGSTRSINYYAFDRDTDRS